MRAETRNVPKQILKFVQSFLQPLAYEAYIHLHNVKIPFPVSTTTEFVSIAITNIKFLYENNSWIF